MNINLINVAAGGITQLDGFLRFETLQLNINLENDQLDTHLIYFTMRLL